MNWYRMFFVQTSTLPPRMHQKLTKRGRFCKQNNQLPTKSHDELKDNSIMCTVWGILTSNCTKTSAPTLPNTKYNQTSKRNRDPGTTNTKTKNDFQRDLTTGETKIWPPTTLILHEACPSSTTNWVEFPTSRFTKLKQFKPMISSPVLCK
jgi:hypothetical protein